MTQTTQETTTQPQDVPYSTGCSSRLDEPWFLNHQKGKRNPPKNAEYSGFKIPQNLAKKILRSPELLRDLTDATKAHYIWLRRDRYAKIEQDRIGYFVTIDGRKHRSFAVLEGGGPDYYTVRAPGMDWILEVWTSHLNTGSASPSPGELKLHRWGLCFETRRFIEHVACTSG